ncbi:carbonic anhydrase [Stipitochalara longipes BDJ]|nr:carbonic anhydrase [Stipitochalara longipes BDJ]
MPGPKWEEMLERNRVYSESKHTPQPLSTEAIPLLGTPASVFPRVLVFSCLDFRAPPLEFLDVKGNEIFVVQNLGGRVKGSLNSLIFLDTLSQGTALEQVVIIHHTNCGLTLTTEEGLHDALKAEYSDQAEEIEKIEFGNYDGSDAKKHEESIREDIAFLRSSPLVRKELKENVRGYVYDIISGKLLAVPH